MLPGMPAKPTIAIVGAGNLAGALAVSLRAAGYRIDQIVARESARKSSQSSSLQRARRLAREVGASAVVGEKAQIRAEVVWFCVPDAAIADAAAALAGAAMTGAATTGSANWSGKVALHSSGALTSDELETLRRLGAEVASVHPLMTFVQGSRPSLAGVPFAVEGTPKAVRVARAMVRKLRGRAINIRKEQKNAYHAWGMFVSPLLTALLAAGERVAGAAGVGGNAARERMLPILRQTLANYARLGAAGAFSGPIVRGDLATVEKHLNVLREVPGAREIYVALARAALRDLPAKNRAGLEKILKS
jgi:predicted short-subunit dehydrogenase-like oxidoreductase (DUF2520 family)